MELRGKPTTIRCLPITKGHIAYWHQFHFPFEIKHQLEQTCWWHSNSTEWKRPAQPGWNHSCVRPASGFIQNCNGAVNLQRQRWSKKDQYQPWHPMAKKFPGDQCSKAAAKTVSILIKSSKPVMIQEIAPAGWTLLVPALVNAFEKNIKPGFIVNTVAGARAYFKGLGLPLQHKLAGPPPLRWNGRKNQSAIQKFIWPPAMRTRYNRPNNLQPPHLPQTCYYPHVPLQPDLTIRFGTWQMKWGRSTGFSVFQVILTNCSFRYCRNIPKGYICVGSTWGMLPSYNQPLFSRHQQKIWYTRKQFICAVEFGKRSGQNHCLQVVKSGNEQSVHFKDRGRNVYRGIF